LKALNRMHNISKFSKNEPVHIITSSIEHPSIMNTCRVLETEGIEVTYLPVDDKGRVIIEELKEAIKSNTKLVSIMLANNETGTIQPIAEIGWFLKQKNILLHTDAVQAVGHIPVDVNELNVDFLSASAHKFNGAKGTGILYKRSGVGLFPMIFGGEQENKLRAGTENVAGIIAAGYAIEENIGIMKDVAPRLKKMVDCTMDKIQKTLPAARINGDYQNRVPGIINLGFNDVSGASIMHLLDLKGICISTGSSCSSGSDEPSHVLLALGLSEKQAKSSVRISYGRYNTMEEVEIIISMICDAYNKIKSNINTI